MVETQWDEEKVAQEFNGEVVSDDFFNETLSSADIKEVKVLIPPSQNVLVQLKDVTVLDVYKDDGTDRPWKMIIPRFKLLEGVEIGDEIKYKNMMVDGNMLCYFASRNKYDYTKPFYKNAQHLVEFNKLLKACDITLEGKREGFTNEQIAQFIEDSKGAELLINITQPYKQAKNPESGLYEATDEKENKAVGFKQA